MFVYDRNFSILSKDFFLSILFSDCISICKYLVQVRCLEFKSSMAYLSLFDDDRSGKEIRDPLVDTKFMGYPKTLVVLWI